jgi:hypothetical protein
MDLDQALAMHTGWRSRLRAFLRGGSERLDPALVRRDDRCDLGQWLHGAGRREADESAWQSLVAEHAQFHAVAAEIVELAVAGQQDLAAARLDEEEGAFARATLGVVKAIATIKAKMSRAA